MRGLASWVFALGLGACAATPHPLPRSTGHEAGYYDAQDDDTRVLHVDGRDVTIAIVHAKDSDARKLVRIDDGGRWHEIATLPAEHDGLAITSFMLLPTNGGLELVGHASNETWTFWLRRELAWDAARGEVMLGDERIDREGVPQPNSYSGNGSTLNG